MADTPSSMSDARQRTPAPDCRPGGASAWALAGVLGIIAIGLIASRWSLGRAFLDQCRFHEPAIRAFAEEWPRFDFRDYRSATTPGYHVVMATVARFVTDSRVGLQVAGLVFSLALAGLFGWAVGTRATRRGVPWLTALAVALPLIASAYVLMPAAWLLPDNAAWLGVLVLVLLALRPEFRWIEAAMGGVVLAALVFTRQSHLWCAGLIWVWAVLSSGPFERWSLGQLMARPAERLIAGAWGVAVTLPAFAIVWYFYHLWGGLTPPRFQSQHAGGNPATPALCLSLIAIYSVFFAAWMWPGIASVWQKRRWVLLAAGATGLVLAVVPATTYLYEPRGSGLWSVVKVLDQHGIVILGRTSPLIVVLSTAGGVCLVGWLALLKARERAVMLAAFVGFIAAQSLNANAWQRYLEPMFLMLLALIAAGSPVGEDAWSKRLARLRVVGPLALAVALAGVSVYLLRQDLEPAARREFEMRAGGDPKAVP